jgi:hypothetical protein
MTSIRTEGARGLGRFTDRAHRERRVRVRDNKNRNYSGGARMVPSRSSRELLRAPELVQGRAAAGDHPRSAPE